MWNEFTMLITLLVFIFILGLLIFVHEFGHYWVAKRSGITVREFAFGFKPRLVAWKRGETEYAINLLPFGGYVRLEGESENTGKKSYMAQSPGVRAKVIVAGVVMNIILAWFLLTLTYGFGSYPLSSTFGDHPGLLTQANVVVANVTADSPAQAAGLQAGDKVTTVNNQAITSANDFSTQVKKMAGEPITLTYVRGNRSQNLTVTPRLNPPAGQGALGIETTEATVVRAVWHKAPAIAILEIGSEIRSSFVGFGQFVGRLLIRQEVSQDVTGIVGISSATGVVRRLGIAPLMQFTALISVNLAVINILPILPLDGGHLLFLAIEALRKRAVKEVYRQWVALAGLGFILLLVLVVTYQDFIHFAIFDRLKNIF